MFAIIKITGTIEVITGMHIGGNSAFSAIGAVDSPVIKDTRTSLPMIPGSSLKGKLRALLAKQYNKEVAKTPDDDAQELTDLFGSSRKNDVHTSRLIFSDMIMDNWDELKEQGLTSKTEVKFENSIKRTTAVANPRQIERVVRGSKFPLDLIYHVKHDGKTTDDEATEIMKRDFRILKEGLTLLEYDYIGGSGSRGYGKVKFSDLEAKVVVGNIANEILEECNGMICS